MRPVAESCLSPARSIVLRSQGTRPWSEIDLCKCSIKRYMTPVRERSQEMTNNLQISYMSVIAEYAALGWTMNLPLVFTRRADTTLISIFLWSFLSMIEFGKGITKPCTTLLKMRLATVTQNRSKSHQNGQAAQNEIESEEFFFVQTDFFSVFFGFKLMCGVNDLH